MHEADGQWIKWDIMFQAAPEETRYVCITGARTGAAGQTSWLVSSIRMTITLSPDLLIIRESVSAEGGKFEASADVVRKVPRSYTEKDVQGLLDMMNLVVLQKMAGSLGLQIGGVVLPSADEFADLAAESFAVAAAEP
ncbi:MAG: hypothetical protein Q8S56_02870, partial [Polaromonas sp.]|nr:hypothetical protein [Polaromonas sp.]